MSKPTGGIEPPIFRLEVGRLIHWATRAELHNTKALAGFEPAIFGLQDRRLNQLSHKANKLFHHTIKYYIFAVGVQNISPPGFEPGTTGILLTTTIPCSTN